MKYFDSWKACDYAELRARHREAGRGEKPFSALLLRIIRDSAQLRLCGAPHNRKNWLFAGSDEGGERAAVLYSLIESAKRSGVEPWAYLRDVLERISTHPMNRIGDLMPNRWKSTSASQ